MRLLIGFLVFVPVWTISESLRLYDPYRTAQRIGQCLTLVVSALLVFCGYLFGLEFGVGAINALIVGNEIGHHIAMWIFKSRNRYVSVSEAIQLQNQAESNLSDPNYGDRLSEAIAIRRRSMSGLIQAPRSSFSVESFYALAIYLGLTIAMATLLNRLWPGRW
jgi:hypothetical protein